MKKSLVVLSMMFASVSVFAETNSFDVVSNDCKENILPVNEVKVEDHQVDEVIASESELSIDDFKSILEEFDKEQRKDTLLHFAAEKGYFDFVKYLVEVEGTDINLENADGETPISLAKANGFDNIVDFLSQYEKVESEEIKSESNFDEVLNETSTEAELGLSLEESSME